MKKKLHLKLALVLFVGTLALAACSENVDPTIPYDIDQEVDIFDPRATDGDEKDSIRDPDL